MAKLLFTSFYQDKNSIRQRELELCMLMNIDNELIDRIYVFLEGKKEDFKVLHHPKVEIIESRRPTYTMFFEQANSVGTEEDIKILSNTDIFFDDSLELIDRVNMNSKCLALSRWHYHENGKMKLHNEKFSQDVWIFKGNIKPIKFSDFHMGIRGCDNRIAYEIHQAGYVIENPSKSIKTIHYHLSEVRNYDLKTIPKPYLPVEVTELKLK